MCNEKNFSYGTVSNVLSDTVTMRLKLGYKYYWEYGDTALSSETDRQYRVCEERKRHTLHHSVLSCPHIAPFRNPTIPNVIDQIIW